ncbi:MAG TPA: DcrB-related protein [Solirubrobacteraceae bacterium]|jgi:hypothetical protein|nr:DcrB-related protein [Solirubrobacteraceae bacterium]
MVSGCTKVGGYSRAVVAVCAAALALAGCASGVSKPSGTTAKPAPATPPASSTATSPAATATTATHSGPGFTTTIPSGFSSHLSAAKNSPFNFLYFVVGPRRTNINVVRERTGAITNMNVIAAAEVRTLKRVFPRAHGFSRLDSLTVDGVPARAIDYLNGATGKLFHQRQIFAAHNGSTYVITYTAIPSLYAASSQALSQVLRTWHWT